MTRSIAVAGKGGTGKSTLAALLISRLCAAGRTPVLAVDADPDCNLGTLLGTEAEQTIGELREEMQHAIRDFPPGMTKTNYIEAGLHQVIGEYKGYDLITMGRGEGASCYCYINSLIRKFCDDLPPSYAWMIMDNEAGLEHLSRRTTRDIDALLVLVGESPLSFSSAGKISEIVSEMKGRVGRVWVVTSMVKKSRLSEIHRRVGELNLDVLADIPPDEEIEEAVFNGQPLDRIESSAVLDAVDKIIDTIGGHDEHS